MFFNKPKQVIFVDDGLQWCAGIAYKDEIICGCCSGIFPIDKVSEYGREKGVKNAIHTLSWVDLTEGISGDINLDDFKNDWE